MPAKCESPKCNNKDPMYERNNKLLCVKCAKEYDAKKKGNHA